MRFRYLERGEGCEAPRTTRSHRADTCTGTAARGPGRPGGPEVQGLVAFPPGAGLHCGAGERLRHLWTRPDPAYVAAFSTVVSAVVELVTDDPRVRFVVQKLTDVYVAIQRAVTPGDWDLDWD